MKRFLKSLSRIDTNIFSGSHSSYNQSEGGFEVQGKGDTAEITFESPNNSYKTETTLKVYNLSSLKRSSDFKTATTEEKPKVLVNTWHTKRRDNQIIKYSDNSQLAFVFTAEKNVDELFEKLVTILDFEILDYVKELNFCQILQNKSSLTSVADLLKVPGITNEHLKILIQNDDNMKVLLDNDITFNQLGKLNDELFKLVLKSSMSVKLILQLGGIDKLEQVNPEKLSLCLENSYELREALKFVTVEQILGINHIPAELETKQEESNPQKNMRFIGRFGNGSMLGFSHKTRNNEITIKHDETNTKFKGAFLELKDHGVKTFNEVITKDKIEPLKLIHDWYKLPTQSSENKEKAIYFCPALKLMHSEEFDLKFQKQKLCNKIVQINFGFADFCSEKAFRQLLNNNNFSMLDARKTLGTEKLELLYKNKCNTEKMLKNGITIKDLARANTARLQHILENFNKAESALKFVEPKELLGLNIPAMKHSSGIFAKNPEPTKKKQKTHAQPAAASSLPTP